MKSILFVVLFLIAWCGAHGASFTANPVADAFVTTGPGGNFSGNNYGSGGAFGWSAPGLPQGEQQSVLQFNLGGALDAFDGTFGAGQWSLQSVTLQLSAAPANNAIFNTPAAGQFGISWMQNDTWMEGMGTPAAPSASGITFASLQNTFVGAGDQDLGTFSFSGATSGTLTYSLAMTTGLTADLLAGDNLSLRLFGADSSVSGVFNSRTFGTAGNRPLLTVVAVPEPSALMVGVMGLMLVGGLRFMRRQK